MIPQVKVTITHGGTSTDYTPSPFESFTVKHRENNYDTAVLRFSDPESFYYEDKINRFDEVKIYLKDASESAYTQVFGGWARQANPRMTKQGHLPALVCKGYAMALEETHCNRDYGLESSNTSYSKPDDILTDLVHWFTEHSFAGAETGWTIDNTNISDYVNTDIKYINNPYRTVMETVDVICQLSSAIGNGTTAGPHWIVDNSKQFLFAKIGDHAAGAGSPEAFWPDWWRTNEASSTLTQGIDFAEYQVVDKTEEFANHVLLLTDFRRPVFDYWTEDSGGAALWGNDGYTSVTDSADQFVVGSHSLKLDPDAALNGWAYLPSTADANWDITKWGSSKTIPHVNFYMYKNGTVSEIGAYIIFSTNDTARKTDYFYCAFSNWSSDPDDQWIHKSIPIGPYWASTEESKQYRWVPQGNPSWSNIDTIEFRMVLQGADALMYIDDLHFSGKIIRSAIDTTGGTYSVDDVNEYQKVLIARNSMDDSCIASDDSGFAARIARAELLRRNAMPKTFVFQTSTDMKAAMAGQKTHLHLCKKRDATFRVDTAVRMPEIQIDWSNQGVAYTVTATTDVMNSFPMSLPDQYAMWQENMFVNSAEAKNIRSGAEVDLLIAMLQKDY